MGSREDTIFFVDCQMSDWSAIKSCELQNSVRPTQSKFDEMGKSSVGVVAKESNKKRELSFSYPYTIELCLPL